MPNEVVLEEIKRIAAQPQNHEAAVVVLPLFDESVASIDSSGNRVIRSNHLGNDYPSNQAFVNNVAHSFFELYDRTTGKDRNYFPWTARIAGESVDIATCADEDLLSPFFTPNPDFYSLLGRLPTQLHNAQTPAQLHYQSQKMLHPETCTFSEWILANQDQVETLVNAVSGGFQIFDRQVGSDGRVGHVYGIVENPGQKVIETAEYLAEAVLEGKAKPKEGLLLHKNDLNLYLDMTVEALKPHNQIEIEGETWGYVLHGAGPDMIKYATGHWRELSQMHYKIIRRFPEIGLPRKIVFGIVPTAEIKLALPISDRELLDELAQLLKRRDALKRQRKDADVDKTTLAASDFELRQLMREVIADSRLSIIDFNRAFSTHYTQYDVLNMGPIYFPEELRDVTFGQLREVNNNIAQARKKAT